MKIVKKNEESIVSFYEVKIGEVFECDLKYFIKLGELKDWNNCTINAIYLETGAYDRIDDDEFVTLVDCELVIK